MERIESMVENFMDRFTSPEEFIRHEILANRGSNNVIDKSQLLAVVGWTAGEGVRLDKLTKSQLFDMIVEQYGDKAYTMFPVGVSSICFQLKFGITNREVLKLAKSGVLTVTGERKFRRYGKYLYAKLYSPYDYFRLTATDVKKALSGK